jgi:preprotein translocase subunit YajC
MISKFIDIEIFSLIIAGINLIMLVLFIAISVRLKKINKNYNTFMKKLGKGEDIDEMLRGYLSKVEEVEKENTELKAYCTKLSKNLTACIQKTGMIRYNAFKDTGSDLSFALALLDDNNDGVVLNGIYSREMSNIYAKQIVKGEAESKLSEEEKEAIYKAISERK